MNKEESLKKFGEYLVIRNYRPKTKKSYTYALRRFFEYCQSCALSSVSFQDYARSYLVYRFGTGKSWHTVNIDYSAIRAFCEHVICEEWDYKMAPRPLARI